MAETESETGAVSAARVGWTASHPSARDAGPAPDTATNTVTVTVTGKVTATGPDPVTGPDTATDPAPVTATATDKGGLGRNGPRELAASGPGGWIAGTLCSWRRVNAPRLVRRSPTP